MREFWFELIHLGIKDHLEPAEFRRVRMLNAIALVSLLLIVFYLPIFLLFGIKVGIGVNITGILICAFTIYLNHLGRYTIARTFFCVANCIYFTANSILFGEAIGIEHVIFASFILPLLLFKNYRAIAFLLSFSVLSFIVAKVSYSFSWLYFTHDVFEYFYYTNILFTFVMLYVIVNGFKYEHENYEKEIEKKNEAITDSLRYAQRIQQAILGGEWEVIRNFREGFIFFSPKDIVSGDFFWYSQVFFSQPPLSVHHVLIAADCTGHGVPGAFMTMMGNAALNEIVDEQNITEPHRILEELDKKIAVTFQKQRSNQNDGMDISVLVLEERDDGGRRVRYAGAKNPLYYVRNGEMKVIKASKFPIGGARQYAKDKAFETHDIEWQEGDVFYIFSDGFQDQFGGKDNSKYLVKRFRNFLAQNSGSDMAEQREKLSREFSDWKGKREQTDDVLVIGVKF